MHLKIIDLEPKAGKPKLKRPRLKLSPKVKSLLVDSLWTAAFGFAFAVNLNAAMQKWTQHQDELACFLYLAGACYSLIYFLFNLWSGLSHLDQ